MSLTKVNELDNYLTDVFNHFSQIKTRHDSLLRSGYINRTIAAECIDLLPHSFARKPINTFTITPSKTNYKFAAEEMGLGMWALIAAAVGALATGGWFLYKHLAKKNGWPIPGGEEAADGKTAPKDQATADKAAKTAAENATAAISNEDALLGDFDEARKKLAEIVSLHDGLMKVKKESLQGSDTVVNNILSGFGSNAGTGVQITFSLIDSAIIKNMFDKDEPTFKFLRQDKSIPANNFFFSGRWKQITTLLGTIKTKAGSALNDLSEVLDKLSNIDFLNDTETTELNKKFSNVTTAIKNAGVGTILEQIKKELNTGSPNSGKYISFIDLLNKVISADYKDTYVKVNEFLYLDDNSIFKVFSKTIVGLSQLDEKVQKRKAAGAKERPAGGNGSDTDKVEVKRDDLAKNLMANIRVLRTIMKEIQHAFTDITPIIEYCHWVNKQVGYIFNKLIITLDKIYTDNGKKIDKMTELTNEMLEHIKKQVVTK